MLSIKEINLLEAQNEGLKKQNAELQKENTELKAYYDVNEDFKTAWAELKAENERLKEEIEIRDNLSEKFRKEALSWANIANDYQKDRTKLEQTLQEIKEMILYCDDEYDCDKCRYHDKCQPNEGEFPDFSKALLQKISESEVK